MSDRKTLRLHKWLDDPYRESLPTWVVESIRSVLAENRGHRANNTDLAARCNHLERRAVKAEARIDAALAWDLRGETAELTEGEMLDLMVKALKGEPTPHTTEEALDAHIRHLFDSL